MSCLELNRTNTCHAFVAALFVWLTLSTVPALAVSGDMSFMLRISEKEAELVHTDSAAWKAYDMRDVPFQRMSERNLPVIELTNNLDTPLMEFHLTIGDTRFNFTNDFLGSYALLKSTRNFQITSNTLNNLGDELVVHIGNGGLKKADGPLRFQIDLDVDSSYLATPHNFFPHPDYRTVLFDIIGIDPYGPQGNEVESDPSADNAEFWAKYESMTTEKEKLPDAEIAAAYQGFYNEHLRPYRLSEPVGLFVVGGGEEIPEPTSAVLATAGLIGCGLYAGRRTRRPNRR
jgi:hypothetical protein